MKILINESSVDWEDKKSYYFFNPLHPQAKKLKALASRLPFFENCIYLHTSSYQKICLLSKQAFLISAQAVNSHLESHSKDKWLLSLPLHHVGGLSILARSFVGRYDWISSDIWNPSEWIKQIQAQQITLSSLVPTQVYDLVKKNLKAPKHLRAIVVGGAHLSSELYKKARDLGWPLLASYGLTEACSQVATAELSSLNQQAYPPLKILSHVHVKSAGDSLWLKSPSLLQGYFDPQTETFEDPKDQDQWFPLEDFGKKEGDYLKIEGRKDEQIKILGEMVHLTKLSQQIKALTFSSSHQYELLATKQERRGHELNLITDSFHLEEIFKYLKQFNKQVLPYEKISKIYCLAYIETDSLSKVRQHTLKKQIGLANKQD